MKDKKKYRLAIEEFRKALSLDPEHVQSLNAMGICYDQLGEYSQAIKSYEKALQINPNLDYANNNLGYSYLLWGKYDLAINAFKKATELNDLNFRYHNNLGLAYVKTGQYQLARIQFEKGGAKVNFYSNRTLLLDNEAGYAKVEPIQQVCGSNFFTKGLFKNQVQFDKKTNQNDSEKIAEELSNVFFDLEDLKDEKKRKNDSKANVSKQGDTKEKLKHKKAIINDISHTFKQDKAFKDKTRIKGMANRYPTFNPNNSTQIEVSKGNGVNRMATRIGEYLRDKDFSVSRLTNAEHFNFKETKLYYCPGYLHEAFELAQ